MSDERMRAFAEAWNRQPRRVESGGVVSYYENDVLVRQHPAQGLLQEGPLEVRPMVLPDLSFLFPEEEKKP